MAPRTKTETAVNKADHKIVQALGLALDRRLENSHIEDNSADLSHDSFVEIDKLVNAIESSKNSTPAQPVENMPVSDIKEIAAESQDAATFFPEQLKAANDDKGAPSFYEIFKSRTSSSLYWTTSAISLLWLTGGVTLALNVSKSSSVLDFFNSSTGFGLISGTLFPICAFWGFAKLSKNSNDLSAMIKSLSNTHIAGGPHLLGYNADFGKLGSKLREEITNMDDGIQRTFERACEVEAIVSGEVNNLERAYVENEARIHSLITMLANERLAIIEHADRVKKTLQLTRNEISDELASVTDNITNNVEVIAENLGKSLNNKTKNILENLHSVSDSLTDVLTNKLDIKGDSYLGQLDNLFDRIDTTIVKRGSIAADKFDANLLELVQSTDGTISQINDKFESIDVTITERGQKMLSSVEHNLDNLFAEIPEKVTSATKTAIKAFEANLEALNTVLTDENKSVLTAFLDHTLSIEESTDKLAEILDTRARSLNEGLKERIAELEDHFEQGGDRFLSAVDSLKTNLVSEVISFENKLDQIFLDKSKDVSAQLNIGASLIANLIENTGDRLTGDISSQIAMLTNHLDSLEEKFTERVLNFNQLGAKNIEALNSYEVVLSEQTTEMLATLNESISSYNKQITDKIANSLQINYVELHSVLTEQAEGVQDRINNLQDLIKQADTQFNALLTKQSASIEDVVSYNSDNLQSNFNNHLTSLQEYANMIKSAISQSDALQTDFVEQKNSLESMLDSKAQLIKNSTSSLQVTLDTNLKDSFQLVEEKAEVVSRILHNEISNAASLFTKEASTAQEYVHKISDELAASITKFENDYSILHSNILSGTEIITDEVMNSIKDIEASVSIEAKNASQQIVAAGEYVNSSLVQAMVDMEQSLTERSATFNDSVLAIKSSISEKITQTEDSLKALTEQNAGQFSSQLEQINNTSQTLYSASVNATHSFNNIAESLHEQLNHSTQALQNQLSSGNEVFLDVLADRSAQITESVEKLNADLRDNIFALASKLDNSGDILLNKTETLTETLIENVQQAEYRLSQMFNNNNHKLQNLSKDAKTNVERLTENFAEHANLLNQVSSMLDESQDSFTGKLGQHNDALQQLFKSLEHKTQEITKSMVAYKAIVEKSGENVDQLKSTSLTPLKSRLNTAANRFIQASSIIDASTNELESALHSAPQQYEHTKTQPRSLNKNSINLKNAINEQIAALHDISNVVNSPSTLTNAADTLHNYTIASSKQKTTDTKAGETLQQLANSIIESVNARILVSLWSSYKKDQRNIDVSKLYTAKGVLLFGHIRSKYRVDPIFRSSVDAYITEFENILKRLSAAGDRVGVYNYLQSDSGKIYTMLAHVAGRIE